MVVRVLFGNNFIIIGKCSSRDVVSGDGLIIGLEWGGIHWIVVYDENIFSISTTWS